MNADNIDSVCKKFGISDIVSRDEIKSGNINNTVKVNTAGGKSYIVQQISTYVFKNPEPMMDNIARVTGHILKKLGTAGDRMVLEFLKTEGGSPCFFDEDGGCWRAYRFIDNSVTYDTCDDLYILKQAGIAFGRFQTWLDDFDASSLYETIPDFHNTEKRMNKLFEDAEKDILGRRAEAEKEIRFFKDNYERAVKLSRLVSEGKLPLRVTHNDTKCNNVLFDAETKSALAVIDLDTVMPGLALHDYGDAVRFSASTAEEDERDTSKIALDIDKFKAFTAGYLSMAGEMLTDMEKENLVDGIIVIALELASRFLDDYLTGDKYFKTDYAGHNLVRTRAQIALAADVIAKYDELNSIIKNML